MSVPLMFQPLVRYVDFQGRSRRSEFWLWVLFRILLGMVMGVALLTLLGSSLQTAESDPQQFMSRYFTVMPVFQLVNLALLLPSLAVGVRRLHDINRSGWWIIMPFVVSIIGFILFFIFFGTSLIQLLGNDGSSNMTEAQGLQFALQSFGALALCVILPILIAEIVMLVFYVTDGTPSSNRFGPDPKGRGGKAAVF